MRVLYDGYIYSLQNTGGINRYFAGLIDSLPNSFWPALTTTHIRDLSFPKHQNLCVHRFPRFGFRPGRISYWSEGLYFRTLEKRSKIDIYHPTYYSLLTQRADIPKGQPVVATIFDLVHEHYPEITDKNGQIRAAKRALVQRADAIICLSDHTKNDVSDYFKIPFERIAVIPPGVSSIKKVSATGQTSTLLFVGNRWSYKNFPIFIEALSIVVKRIPQARALVVGPSFSEEELKLLSSKGVSNLVELCDSVDDATLSSLYARSAALVYPSSFEGFGFPLVEAMSAGVPVIASSCASIPEVLDNAGLLVPPCNAFALAEVIEKLLTDVHLSEKLRASGLKRSQAFSWERCSEAVTDTYRQLI